MNILRLSTLSLALVLTMMTLGFASSSFAKKPVCDPPQVPPHPSCKDNGDGGDGSTPPFDPTQVAAIGHPLGCLACTLPGAMGPCATTNATGLIGDIVDVGTLHEGHEGDDMHVGNICEQLQCAEYGGGGGSVDCGHNSRFNDEPEPRVDINGLLARWDDDGTNQGEPDECFGDDGIINGIVSVANGTTGQANVQIFFKAKEDTTVNHKKCSMPAAELNYSVAIQGCDLDVGNFPPVDGAPATITCGSGTAWTVNHQGGGGTAAKCGCHSTGTLSEDTTIFIKFKPDE